jgi:hypothetical protein
MSLGHGTNIVTSSLVFSFDPGNIKNYSGSGTSTTELVGGAGVGTATNTTYSSSNSGYMSYNGSSSIVTFNNNTALDTQAVTVEVWVTTNALNQNGFWFEKGSVNSQYALFQEGVSIQWRLGSLGDLSTTTATYMTTGTWYQVVGTYTTGDRRLYINGVQVNSNATTGVLGTNASGMSIGAYGGKDGAHAYYYNGNIAIVRVYRKNLSPAEVLQNFNANRGRFGI